MGTKKKLTLEQFIEQHGTQRRAAEVLGVPEPTLNRWLKRRIHPRGLSLRRLHEFNIDVRTLAAKATEVAALDVAATAR